jgi:hypothetical protein
MFILLYCYLGRIRFISFIFVRSLVDSKLIRLLSYESNGSHILCGPFFLNIVLLLNKNNQLSKLSNLAFMSLEHL